MDPVKSMEFKKGVFKSTWIGYGLVNVIVNAVVFYFSHRNESGVFRSAFTTNIIFTGVILSLICSSFVMLTLSVMNKKDQIGEHSYDRRDHLLIHFFPKNSVLQLIVVTILVTLHFTVFGTGLCVVLGYSESIPVLQAAIINGILCGLMGMSNVYLMYVARITSYKMKNKTKTVS